MPTFQYVPSGSYNGWGVINCIPGIKDQKMYFGVAVLDKSGTTVITCFLDQNSEVILEEFFFHLLFQAQLHCEQNSDQKSS